MWEQSSEESSESLDSELTSSSHEMGDSSSSTAWELDQSTQPCFHLS